MSDTGYVKFKGVELLITGPFTSSYDRECGWKDCNKIIKEGKTMYNGGHEFCCSVAHAKKADYNYKKEMGQI